MKTSICGITLKAIRFGNFLDSTSLDREHRLGLREQFVHRVLAGARHRLIGRDHDALDRGLVVQRLQRHDELRGRAVRIGDDVLLGKPATASAFTSGTISGTSGSMRHARRIVDHDGALRADLRRPFLRHRRRRPTSGRCRRRRNRSSRALCTFRVLSPNDTSTPIVRRDASATTSSAGNFRSSRMLSISRPTLPVAPTTATL